MRNRKMCALDVATEEGGSRKAEGTLMPGKRLTLSQYRRIATLRAAGYTSAAIGCDISTVQRFCRRHAIAKGAFRREVIEKARAELLDDAAFVDMLKTELRALSLDTLTQVRKLRDRIAVTMEHVEPRDLETAGVSARALAAISTSLKVSADTLKGLEGGVREAEELPQLVVGVMDDAEIEAVRKSNLGENADGFGEMDAEAMAELFGSEG
jgi:hypothetical protein